MSEYIPSANCIAFFHGEQWHQCPHCDFQFEIYEAEFEARGIKKLKKKEFIFVEIAERSSVLDER